MKFRHVIEVNQVNDARKLSREQLWRGLVMRAEAPQSFMPHLDACRLFDRTADSVRRVLRYGELHIHDVVTYEPQVCVRYQVPAQGEIPASSMSMRIEESDEGVLLVHFDYDYGDGDGAPPDSEQACCDQFRSAVYEKADIDTIRIMRELLAS